MTKHVTLKRLLTGLLLFCGVFAYASSNTAAAGGMGDMTMELFCDSWEENIKDYSDQEHCWSCQIFLLFFDAANKVAGEINNALSGPVISIIGVFVGLYLAFNTLIYFGDVGDAPDLMGFLTKLGGMMVKTGIGVCFLKGGASLAFEYIVNPVLTDAANLASDILDAAGQNSVSCPAIAADGGSKLAPMGPGVRSSLECMIKKIASGMARSQSIAQGLRCGAFFWYEIDIAWPISIVLPLPKFYILNPIMWLVGMWLGCLFWIVSFLFPIAMLDVIFRIGLTVGMLPLFIAAWIFPITTSFAKTAWEIFLHSCMVFAITGIIVCMTVMMVESAWVSGDSTLLQEFQSKMEASAYVEAWDLMFDNDGLSRLFIVMCVAVWGLYVAPIADKLSGKFISSDKEFPESCGIRAIRGTIFFIMDVILAIITIISFGATSCLYVLKLAKHLADGAQKVEQLKRKIDKVREMRKRIQKIQRTANKVKNNVSRAANAATHS